MRTRTFAASALVLTLLLAGVASYYASTHPDGLERVAEQMGFADRAKDPPDGGGPMGDYRVDGVDSPRLAGGLAGVIGVVVTLVLAGGLGHVVRRRRPDHDADPDPDPARREERV